MNAHPIKVFREAQVPPLSQEALADKIGVNRVTLARWETGDRKPGPTKLPRITKVTGIPARALRPDLAARAALFREAAE